jgi:hypothetical protein
MSTDLVPHHTTLPSEIDAPMTGGELETLYRLAKAMSMSGFFKDARDAEKALAKLVFGRDLGVSATAALTQIHIIEGKPEISANLQAQMLRRAGYDFRVVTPDELRDTECEIVALRDGEEVGREKFTMKDAQRADLAKKDVWRKYPRNMLWARAMSNVVAFHCPEVTQGIRVYAEGEIRDAPEERDEPTPQAAPVIDEESRQGLFGLLEELDPTPEQLRMWLVSAGVSDVGEPMEAVRWLTRDQADALIPLLSDALGRLDQRGQIELGAQGDDA